MDVIEVLNYHPKVKDIRGRRFFKLVPMKLFKKLGTRVYLWECQCDCGKRSLIAVSHMGKQKTCGCGQQDGVRKHGLGHTRIYKSWNALVARCTNPKHKQWPDYGGRGIAVCDSWRNSFVEFHRDMGASWKYGLTIERIDVNGGYNKKNCRWATIQEQTNNRRNNRPITIDGVTKNMNKWCTEHGISMSTFRQRLMRGWDTKRALTQPTDKSLLPEPSQQHVCLL